MGHRQDAEADSTRHTQAREFYAAYLRGEGRDDLRPIATRVPVTLQRALRLLSVSSGEPVYQMVTEAIIQYLDTRLVIP